MKTLAAEIRLAEPRDAPELSAVHDASWRGAYGGLIPHRCLEKMIGRRDAGWWSGAIRSGAAILVVEFAGAPVGYATLGRNRTRAFQAEGEIYELYLQPEYQGLGFGKRLFKSAVDLLQERGLKGLVVWALAENHRAIEFYGRLGGRDIAQGSERFETREVAKVAFVWT
ncbi:GNAT family N-acetyltransferase [Aurantimonas sp. A2-1-M11]|uniref:GNAT family N-acetyltransferase n=1 Tax=Aurantimonas sp. A2-1-M11 TaxID=3113712 RepID=UPI002F91F851